MTILLFDINEECFSDKNTAVIFFFYKIKFQSAIIYVFLLTISFCSNRSKIATFTRDNVIRYTKTLFEPVIHNRSTCLSFENRLADLLRIKVRQKRE